MFSGKDGLPETELARFVLGILFLLGDVVFACFACLFTEIGFRFLRFVRMK